MESEADQLRLMAVHAHPDDESSKGAATMARYVREGVQVLVHVGIDTVARRGRGFTAVAGEGEQVVAGDLLVRVDLDALRADGVEMLSPVVVISGHAVVPAATERVVAGEPLLEVVVPG